MRGERVDSARRADILAPVDFVAEPDGNTMARTTRGVFETLVTTDLEQDLAALDRALVACVEAPNAEDVVDRVALHVAQAISRSLRMVDHRERVERARLIANRVMELLGGDGANDSWLRDIVLPEPLRVLTEIAGRRPDGEPARVERPEIPLLDSVLLTNARREPRVLHQLRAEIASAEQVDLVMAFIVRSGIRPLQDALLRHCREEGRVLRVLTTTFTGTTEPEALEQLAKLGADVRVSYDHEATRLHAKAWIFHRPGGFHTAYVGSSNLTRSGTETGREWNVRVSGARNPNIVKKMVSVFDAYWSSGDFEPFEVQRFREARRGSDARSGSGAVLALSPVEVRLDPFQERLLEQIELARDQGRHRNLLVAATGTGKTVMAAEDYRRLRTRLPRARLLFVAHRYEILERSMATFRHVLRDPAFGELWVGGNRPARFEHVFASIQSLAANGLEYLAADHFDVVIVDEFHHAAAPTYTRLLDLLRPAELLGLTATPERSDGESVLRWFDERIAAELRLWDAIEQQRLCPFEYHGVADGRDLRGVRWLRGRGYDPGELSRLYTADHAYARQVLAALHARVDDVGAIRCLGFCVSVDHARFMAALFTEAGLPARAVWAETPSDERAAALRDLDEGRLPVLFAVDLFNEGVDIPRLDTLLFLRPTDSSTVFLQQLGRGLRRAAGKESCLVLDFVSQHRTEFRQERRFEALLGTRGKRLESQVEAGFPYLPPGCHIELDAVSRSAVLASVRTQLQRAGSRQVQELRAFASEFGTPTLGDFVRETGIVLDDVYERGKKSWSDLREAAGLSTAKPGPREGMLRAAIGRLLHVDDHERLDVWTHWLNAGAAPVASELSVRDHALLRMLLVTMYASEKSAMSNDAAAHDLWSHTQVLAELRELLPLLGERVCHRVARLASHPDVPLLVHAQYSRNEILAALGTGDGIQTATWREGVRKDDRHRCDLLLVTLDKSAGTFSPTTRYRDYAVSPTLFHWESQSTTSDTSETGKRYIGHAERNWSIQLFARLTNETRAFTFLGPATYVKHEAGRPMAVTWRLQWALPGDVYAEMGAAVG